MAWSIPRKHAGGNIRREELHALGPMRRRLSRNSRRFTNGKTASRASSVGCKLIAFQDSLRYFARCSALKSRASWRCGRHRPGPQRIPQVVETSKNKNVRVIAVDRNTRRRAARAAARRALAKAAAPASASSRSTRWRLAQPDDFSAAHQFGKDFYERKMTENVNKLRDA